MSFSTDLRLSMSKKGVKPIPLQGLSQKKERMLLNIYIYIVCVCIYMQFYSTLLNCMSVLLDCLDYTRTL